MMNKYNKTKEILYFSDAHFKDCIFILNYILDLEQENIMLKHNWNELKKWLEGYIQSYENRMNLPFGDVIRLSKEKMLLNNVLDKIQSLEEGGNNE